MTTTVCSRCGASLDPGARFCAGCGQPLSAGPAAGSPAGPGAAGARKVPVLPLAIFGGGLVVLVGTLVYMKSGSPPASQPVPAAAPAAPSSPVTAVPVVPAVPGTAQPATAPLPDAPGTASVFSFPESTPPAVPVASGSAAPSGVPNAGAGGTRAPSTKVWKDPLAGGGVAPPPPAPTRRVAAGPGAPPPPPSNHMASGPPPDARPAAPAPPQVSRTYDCSENVIFNITPEDIHITVDGHSIGTADRWDGATEGRKYTFREPGTHLVKLSHEKYETVWLKFEVSERSIYRTADVEFQMKRLGR